MRSLPWRNLVRCPGRSNGSKVGDEHPIRGDTLRSGPAHTNRVPVVDDDEGGAVQQRVYEPRRIASLDHGGANEVGGMIAGGRIVPRSAHAIATMARYGFSAGTGRSGARTSPSWP